MAMPTSGTFCTTTTATRSSLTLTDLRSVPREWDLALTAIYYDSFGWHTREEYETFVRIYGFDIMQWPGYRPCARYASS